MSTVDTTGIETDQLMEARAYVRTKFFPPLPTVYGDLACVALREYREHGPDARIGIPEGIDPTPRDIEHDDNGYYVTAAELIRILRIEHMIEDEED